jgi:NAD(P)-dependent dehydrogenase (short-subunit alcohol dehydrogenase family)
VTAAGTGQRLSGRGAIVVGGGQSPGETLGNGRATALELALEGAHVLVADRDADAAAATVAAIEETGGLAEPHVMDVTRESDCAELAGKALAALGRVDILINNVGIVADDSTPAAWAGALEVNITGMWLTCRSILPVMVEGGGGAIVNTSSTASLTPAAPGPLSYAVSKRGVDVLTKTLALEYADRGIRVNAVAPGMIDTPLGVDVLAERRGVPREEIARERAEVVPMKCQGSARDVARGVAFLASDDAAYITGVVLPIDGGITLRSFSWDMS